jgi:glycosyltransferase involved in cell wall biosynthesis
VSQLKVENRIAAGSAALPMPCPAAISIPRLRSWLAPSGGYRESLGRTIVRGIRRARRGLRVGWQGIFRAANWSLPGSFPESVARSLRDGATAPYDVFCLPVFNWGFRFQRPQQLMRQFARHGRRVFYVSHDFLLASSVAVDRLEENVYGLKLPADAGRSVLEQALSEAEARGMVGGVERLRAAGKIQAAAIVVQHPFWTPLAKRLRDRFGWPIVYDCMDDYALLYRQGGPMLDVERSLLETADLVVASSDLLQRKTASPARRAVLVRNAAEYEHFAQAGPVAASGENVVVGYYGAIAHWFDNRLVAELARLRPRWRFELVGNTFTADLRPLRQLPNVRLLGEMPYAELPGRMAKWHCCMIPFQRNNLTEATNPVKVYEMLAAGMPVVGVDLPELRPIAAANLIELADDAEGFARKIGKLLAEATPAAIAARREFARKNTWEERYREMSAAIDPVVARTLGVGARGDCKERQPDGSSP